MFPGLFKFGHIKAEQQLHNISISLVQRKKNDGATISNNAHRVHSLCSFDDVPGAVVVHMVFTADGLTVAVAVVTLGLDFLTRGMTNTH